MHLNINNIDIDWGKVGTGTIGLILGVILKMALDLNLGAWLVRTFHWLPVRKLFRTSPNQISGIWDQVWDFSSTSSSASDFSRELDRHSNISMRQFSSYCYGEFYSRQKTYSVYGQIKGDFFYGQWYDKNDKMGYFGSFELRIVDSSNMTGKWIGHSKRSQDIYGDLWTWKKISK